MSSRRKTLDKIRQNPKHVSFEDADKVLRWYGFKMIKDLDYYLSLPYTIEVIRDVDEDDGSESWFARVRELRGCMTEADTFEEVGEMIFDAMTVWIEGALEDGDTVPEPRPVEEYSGKFVTRVPRSLHHELVQAAEREGVSLNAYVNVALARAVGQAASYEPALLSEPRPHRRRVSDEAALTDEESSQG